MPTSLQARPRWFLLPARRPSHTVQLARVSDWALPSLVLLVSLVLAGCVYAQFLRVDRSLWYNPYHDRNAHYLYSLKLATDVQNGRVLQLINDLNRARIWPPLHGMAAGMALLIGGRDYRLAVLPSLAGWVMMVFLGFLVARRAAPRAGNLAGLIAAFFLAASPAHRAYAADIMLESLGAALSLLVLYCYLLTVQGSARDVLRARFLAVSLLLLFLEKYNYWLLVVLALLAAEGCNRWGVYWKIARTLLHGIDWRTWVAGQLRHPLTWGIALLTLASAFVFLHGERPFRWAGHSISLYPPHNLIHVAYVLFFIRLAQWWRVEGRQWARQLDPRLRQIILWLLCPLALWFLLPKHPSYFVWYLSFADRAPHQQMDFLGGCRDYATWAVQDYHISVASGIMAGFLCLCGLLAWRRLRPGGSAVLALVVLASVLTPMHPNHKGRMLHSWIPAVWVTAGLGAASLSKKLTTESRRHREEFAAEDAESTEKDETFLIKRDRLNLLIPNFLFLLFLVFLSVYSVANSSLCSFDSMVRASLLSGHAVEGGPHMDQPSMVDVTDAYLSEVSSSNRTLLLTSLPLKPMAQWTWLERFGNFDALEERWYGFGAGGADNRRGFANWLQTTVCDTLVFCESTISRDGVDSGPECALHAELKDVLNDQRVFDLAQRRELPHLACRVEIWRRETPTAGNVAESR